jgi:hypothetical protein
VGDDEEDQETPFPEMDAHQLAVETAWLRLFLREASTRGYTIEDIVALLDEPGMTVEAAVERILSTGNGEPSQPPKTTHGQKAK